jgi:hypothetical protein
MMEIDRLRSCQSLDDITNLEAFVRGQGFDAFEVNRRQSLIMPIIKALDILEDEVCNVDRMTS